MPPASGKHQHTERKRTEGWLHASSSTITARYAVVYDSSPGSDATRPLVGYVDFGADVVSNNGAFTITWDSTGIAVVTVA